MHVRMSKVGVGLVYESSRHDTHTYISIYIIYIYIFSTHVTHIYIYVYIYPCVYLYIHPHAPSTHYPSTLSGFGSDSEGMRPVCLHECCSRCHSFALRHLPGWLVARALA